jgi:hypothetical protein
MPPRWRYNPSVADLSCALCTQRGSALKDIDRLHFGSCWQKHENILFAFNKYYNGVGMEFSIDMRNDYIKLNHYISLELFFNWREPN